MHCPSTFWNRKRPPMIMDQTKTDIAETVATPKKIQQAFCADCLTI
jgi:hypothetical protein